MFNIEYSNAFIQSAIDILMMVCGQELVQGESYMHHHTEIENSVAIYLGIIGQIQGYVLIRFSIENAKRVASAMIGMPIEEIDDIVISALSELGNMIMGGGSTNLAQSGIVTDITTPTLMQGTVLLQQAEMMPTSTPLTNAELRIVLDIAIKEKG